MIRNLALWGTGGIATLREIPGSLAALGFSGNRAACIRTIAQRSMAEAPYLKQFVGTVSEETLTAALDAADHRGAAG